MRRIEITFWRALERWIGGLDKTYGWAAATHLGKPVTNAPRARAAIVTIARRTSFDDRGFFSGLFRIYWKYGRV